jgi:hypothetical protein
MTPVCTSTDSKVYEERRFVVLANPQANGGIELKHAINIFLPFFRTHKQPLELAQGRYITNYEIIRFQKDVMNILWSIKEHGNQAVSNLIDDEVEACLTKLIHIQRFEANCSTVVMVSIALR